MKDASSRLAFAIFLFGLGGVLCNWPLFSVPVTTGLWPAFRYALVAWGVLLVGLVLLSRAQPTEPRHDPDHPGDEEGG